MPAMEDASLRVRVLRMGAQTCMPGVEAHWPSMWPACKRGGIAIMPAGGPKLCAGTMKGPADIKWWGATG